MNKKRLISAITTGGLVISMALPAFAKGKIFIDLEEVKSDTPSQIINSRTMIPVRAITEMLGYDVNWIEEKKQVEVCEKDSSTPIIIMNIDETRAYYTKYDEELGDYIGVEEILESPATIINNRTFVPLRFISEAVGYTVDYDVDSEDVYMFSPEYSANQEGEGMGETISEEDMNYVLGFTTNSWMDITPNEKIEIATLISKWWAEQENSAEVDAEEMVEELDHQMEQYYKNNADEGVFETACDIYGIDVTNYIKG